jgi:hypothetical protein
MVFATDRNLQGVFDALSRSGGRVNDVGAFEQAGFAIPDLSESMDAESARITSLRIAREFTT